MIRWTTRVLVTLLLLSIVIVLTIEYAPPRWTAKQVQGVLNERLNADISVEEIDLHVIGANPSIRITNLSVSDHESPQTHARAQIASLVGSIRLLELFSGELYVNEVAVSDGTLSAAIDVHGNGNWQYLLPQDTSTAPSSDEDAEAATSLPSIEQLLLNDFQVEFIDEQRSLDTDLLFTMTGSTLEPTPTTMDVNGSVNSLPIELGITTNLLSSLSEENEAVTLGFNAQVGDSDFQGDVRVNPSTTPLTLYANVISKKLDLDELEGIVVGTSDSTQTASGQQDAEPADESSKDSPLLSTDPLGLATIASFFNGAIEYRAEAIQFSAWPLQSLDVRTEIKGTDVTINPLNIGVAGGEISGSLLMDTAAAPVESELDVRIQRVSIRRLLNALEIDNEGLGILGGQIKYWVAGDSVAELAASADGGMFMLMTDGQLDALLVELAGVDLFESVALLIDPAQNRTAINCAYLDLQSDSGVSDIATLVLDTDDAVLLADGVIDLNDESLDLTIEPHPKDISILAAQTAARISGTFTDLSVLPGQTLYARVAAAAVLAALATPAAALIPFTEAGTGDDSAYCDGLISALDDARG